MPRLPSSLKWLIDRRGRVDGEIRKIESSLAKCQKLIETLEYLKKCLDAVDHTLDLHEIKVDPQNIPTIRSHETRVSLPYGVLTRGILQYLRLNKGTSVSTSEITTFIIAEYADLCETPIEFTELKSSVRYRLKDLRKLGQVKSHHKRGHDGSWSLVDF